MKTFVESNILCLHGHDFIPFCLPQCMEENNNNAFKFNYVLYTKKYSSCPIKQRVVLYINPTGKREQPQLWVWLITDPDCYRWQTNCLRKICEVSSFFSGRYCIYENKILLRKKQRFLLTDTRNKIIKSFLRKDRVFQPSEIELQYSSNWVNVMVTLVICQRIFTLKSK